MKKQMAGSWWTYAALGVLVSVVPGQADPTIWESDFGTELSDLTGEDDWTEGVSLGFAFPFLGSSYTDVIVGTNGLVNLGSDNDQECCPEVEDVAFHFLDPSAPTIAPFWSDMSLSSMGTVYFNDFGDRAVVTWDEVGSYLDEYAPFTFQLQLFGDGTIVFGYNGISDIGDNLDEDLFVGVTVGDGAMDPGERDLYDDSPFSAGDTVYEIFEEDAEPFDLDGGNVIFAPASGPLLGTGFDVNPVQVPVPGAALLGIIGFGLIGRARRRFA